MTCSATTKWLLIGGSTALFIFLTVFLIGICKYVPDNEVLENCDFEGITDTEFLNGLEEMDTKYYEGQGNILLDPYETLYEYRGDDFQNIELAHKSGFYTDEYGGSNRFTNWSAWEKQVNAGLPCGPEFWEMNADEYPELREWTHAERLRDNGYSQQEWMDIEKRIVTERMLELRTHLAENIVDVAHINPLWNDGYGTANVPFVDHDGVSLKSIIDDANAERTANFISRNGFDNLSEMIQDHAVKQNAEIAANAEMLQENDKFAQMKYAGIGGMAVAAAATGAGAGAGVYNHQRNTKNASTERLNKASTSHCI